MNCDTVVARPLGEVNTRVTVPLTVSVSNSYLIATLLGAVVLGTGEPPTTVAVRPVVADAVTVVPAASGLKATAFASAAKNASTPALFPPPR